MNSFTADTVEAALTKATRVYPDSEHPMQQVLSALEAEVQRPSAFIKDNFLVILQRGRAIFAG